MSGGASEVWSVSSRVSMSEEGVVTPTEDDNLVETGPETSGDGGASKNEEEQPETEEGATGESAENVAIEETAATSDEPEDEQTTNDEVVVKVAEEEEETEGLLRTDSDVDVNPASEPVVAGHCKPEIEREEREASKERGTSDGEDEDAAKSEQSPSTAPVSSITFHDLGYEVPQRKCFKRLPNKIILDSVW